MVRNGNHVAPIVQQVAESPCHIMHSLSHVARCLDDAETPQRDVSASEMYLAMV
jgi:hypothetical protein